VPKKAKEGSKKTTVVDPRFEKIATEYSKEPNVKRGRLFSSENVLSVNGKIFAMIYKGKLVVKLPADRTQELVTQRVGVNWGPSPNRVMKEWIAIESEKASWPQLAREAYTFVKSKQ